MYSNPNRLRLPSVVFILLLKILKKGEKRYGKNTFRAPIRAINK